MKTREPLLLNPILVLWGLSLALFPVYLFPPASPQASDLIVAALLVLEFTRHGLDFVPEARAMLRAFAWFAWYVVLISLYRTIRVGDPQIMLFAAFYVFNVLRLALAIRLYTSYGRQFLRMTAYGVLAAIGVVTIVALRTTSGLEREELLFNNPNQLGYFSLLAPIVIFQLSSVVRVRWWLQLAAYLGSIWAAILSLSRAALPSMAAFGAVAALRRNLLFLLVVLALLGGYAIADPNAIALERVQQRYATLGRTTGDETWAQRGYDRIVHHPTYLIFGAAEGAFYRFESEALDEELHSSLGTLVFAYGIPGTLLFLAGLLALYQVARLHAILLLGPVFMYGLTHQGLRFPLFWVLLSVLFCVGHARSAQRAVAPRPVPALQPLPAARRGL